MDKLIKISSLSGTFLIFCGVLKLIIYYSAFNVNIVDFLSLSEIATSFLDDLNILLIFALIMTFFSIAFLSIEKKRHQMKIEDYFEMYLEAFYRIRYRFVAFFAGIIILLTSLIYSNIINYSYLIIYILVFSTLQISSYLIMYKTDENKIEIANFALVFSIIISITLSVFLFAQHDIENTKASSNEVVIYGKSSTIYCGKKYPYTYVGKTDNYIFLKRNSNGSGIAISKEIINMIEFK